VNESEKAVIFFFDYVDPGSYVMDAQLARLLPREVAVTRHPFELRPPPQPLLDSADPEWSRYQQTAASLAAELDVELAFPDFMPWTRKAHELRLHAAEKGLEQPMHEGLLKARFQDEADIGRIDVLVDLAVGVGLDLTETKAVLDVDRHMGTVVALRQQAAAGGVVRSPTLKIGPKSLEGPLRIDELEGLLRAARLI